MSEPYAVRYNGKKRIAYKNKGAYESAKQLSFARTNKRLKYSGGV